MQPGLLRRLAELERQRRPTEPARAVFRIVALDETAQDWMRPGTTDYERAQQGCYWPVDNSNSEPVDNFESQPVDNFPTALHPVDNFLRIELEPGDTLLDVALELRMTREELQRRMDAGTIELIYPTEKA